MITKTQAIKSFLIANTHNDLSSLYSHNMECQVNVAKDNGELIHGEYNGKRWQAYTDNIQKWKSFRIPYKANSEPEFTDNQMTYSLDDHAEGIGMTGWNWYDRLSMWVAFDFDAIVGHSDKHALKLTPDELLKIQDIVCDIPWVETRLSTSGNGLHLYVHLDNVRTNNHTEHAAVGRAILHIMSAKTGFDFISKVDICGGNMWVWHRKMIGTQGLKLLKPATEKYTEPVNWRNHLHVVTGKRKCVLPDFVSEDKESEFQELTGQIQKVSLDADHRKLIEYLESSGASFWWDNDHHMLVCHTYDLKLAHEQLGFKGVYRTVSTGSEQGVDHNCFMYPMRKGAWVVRRYGVGTTEAETWDHDANGYPRCYYNRDPDLRTLSACYEGVEHQSGGFVFKDMESAVKAAEGLGVTIKIDPWMSRRKAKLKLTNDKLVVEMDRESQDSSTAMPGWLDEKKDKWTRVFYVKRALGADVQESYEFDDLIRHLITHDGTNYGWVVRSEGQWTEEPLAHVQMALRSMGLKDPEVKNVIGNNIFKPYKLVNLPFQVEYPGDRQWNRDSAQYRFAPDLKKDDLEYPHWKLILNHVGENLTEAVLKNDWCIANNITTGADYLKCWCASLFQNPFEPLPYLFFYSEEQNTGKSIFHEALGLLMTKGYKRADQALKSSGGFNGELEKAILCVIEETSLKDDKRAYNTIKDFVTAIEILIHIKGKTPFTVPNTTHWIHCSNNPTDCPAFEGDTRIVICKVNALTNEIAKRILLERLKKEASDFLAALLKLELPEYNGRLRVPVVITDEKISVIERNQNLLEQFISEEVTFCDGHKVTVAEFYNKFQEWLEPMERHNWTKHKISRSLPDKIIRGRDKTNSQWCYGNITFDRNAKPGPVYTKVGDTLRQ